MAVGGSVMKLTVKVPDWVYYEALLIGFKKEVERQERADQLAKARKKAKALVKKKLRKMGVKV
jgi:hypothetical protein